MNSDILLVTGGASGLGHDIASAAITAGRAVALLDRDADAVRNAADRVGGIPVTADVTRPDQLDRAVAQLVSEHGPIGGVVNSAGLTRPAPAATMDVDDWRLVVDVDLNGTYFVCRSVFPHLSPDSGAIVNVASIAAARGLPGRVAYSAAKAGVVGLTRALATEWAPHGVRVNAVGPSWVDTPLIRTMVADGALDGDELSSRAPLGRMCTTADVASTTLYLLSDAAAFVTGQTIYVDGGYVWGG